MIDRTFNNKGFSYLERLGEESGTGYSTRLGKWSENTKWYDSELKKGFGKRFMFGEEYNHENRNGIGIEIRIL